MALYQLTPYASVTRTADGASIPNDPKNRDRAEYEAWLAGGGIPSHIGIAAAALHAIWQLSRLDIDDPARCLKLFRSNRDFGLIILLGLILDTLTR